MCAASGMASVGERLKPPANGNGLPHGKICHRKSGFRAACPGLVLIGHLHYVHRDYCAGEI